MRHLMLVALVPLSGLFGASAVHAQTNLRGLECSSQDNRYHECAVPFRGTAIITQQISQASCVEGRTWGQRPGVVWVKNGCRARFDMRRDQDFQGRNNGDQRTVVCASNRGERRVCDTGVRGPVRLTNQLNNSNACVEGRTWGQSQGQVWVTNGCRAQFSSANRMDRNDRDDRNDNGNRSYSMTCESNDSRTVRCNWDDRFGTPRLSRQISQSACIQGRTWGYDNRNSLWVSNGCRAQFSNR